MKKIMLVALAAVSAAVFALPATASAIEPLHLNPTPEGAQTIDGNGVATLTTTSGSTVKCNGFSGTATFEKGGTTGNMTLTFGGDCTAFGFTCTGGGAASGSIKTTSLPFHLATVENDEEEVGPGVLVTPNAGHFASFVCGFIPVEVTGTGAIGTITSPECGAEDTKATIEFNGAAGIQEHTTLAGTETEYTLKSGSATAAQDAHGTLTLSKPSILECT